MTAASELLGPWRKECPPRRSTPVSLTEAIASPPELRRLPRARLPAVAAELRRAILATVSRTGGHLGASLGAVELATALHYVFHTPRDRLIWDVGHQGYPHKLLTGRGEALARLGKSDGPAKFLRRSESSYDVFGAGHAGTSVSAAVGVAEAIRRRGGDEHVAAVIGDGALTAGMAYEGLNQAGDLGLEHLVVVLNDNGMSISPNVGALSRHLSGRGAGEGARGPDAPRSTNAPPPAAVFEALGFETVGPIDGHDLDALVEAFAAVRARRGAGRPTLVHCRTQKGHGYVPAEQDPVRYHGVGKFEIGTGRQPTPAPGPPSWTSVFADALVELAGRDERIVGITAAMAEGTGLARFRAAHPERFYDVGIAEQHAVTMAAGMATEGLKPVCAIYSTFLQRAFDQIVHDVCVQGLDVTFAVDRAGLVGADGATHQGLYDYAYLRALPNMVAMAPKDGNELRRMLRTALEHPGPAAVRYPRGAIPEAPLEEEIRPLPLGEAELLREGDDVALVGVGASAQTALTAARLLAREGIDAAVLNARFVKPLDAERIGTVARRARALVTVEEHAGAGGFGEAVAGLLARLDLELPIQTLAIPDRVVEHGDPNALLSDFGLDAEGIARAARELLVRVSGRPRPTGGGEVSRTLPAEPARRGR